VVLRERRRLVGIFQSERLSPSPDDFAGPAVRGGQRVGQLETIMQRVGPAAGDLGAILRDVDDAAFDAGMPVLQRDPRLVAAAPARLSFDRFFHTQSSVRDHGPSY